MKAKKRSPVKLTVEPKYLEAVQQVLGRAHKKIMTEVVSSVEGAASDRALLTLFDTEWHGHVFLHIPPGWTEIDWLCDKWRQEVDAGHITEGIVLAESRTETLWFRQLAAVSDAIVFLTKTADQKTPPLAALYLGPYDGTFTVVFRDFGWPAQHQNTWGE